MTDSLAAVLPLGAFAFVLIAHARGLWRGRLLPRPERYVEKVRRGLASPNEQTNAWHKLALQWRPEAPTIPSSWHRRRKLAAFNTNSEFQPGGEVT